LGCREPTGAVRRRPPGARAMAADGGPSDGVSPVVSLPPDRPGKLSGPAGDDEADAHRGPSVSSAEEMRRIALEEAERTLPQELSMMAGMAGTALQELSELLVTRASSSMEAVGVEDLAKPYAEALADLVWSPLAGCKSSVRDACEEENSSSSGGARLHCA